MAGKNGAMSGTGLMLKAIGIDPEAIMQNVEAAKVTATQVMNHFDARLKAIEGNQITMAEKLAELARTVAEVAAVLKDFRG